MYDMDFFRKVNNAHLSKSRKETNIYEIRQVISRTYDQSVDYQPDTIVDGEEVPLIVMEYHGNNLNRDRIKNIEAPPGSSFRLGSKVECFGVMWLVTEVNYNDQVKISGRMELCNYVLRWQDTSGEIMSEECVVKRYSNAADGEDANKVITVGDTRRNIFLQFNPRTSRITRGRRFFIDMEGSEDPKTYRLTDLDRTTYIYNNLGFFNMTLVESELDETDRVDLMIADYFEPSTPPTPIGSCSILFSGSPIVRTSGVAKVFKALFWNDDDEPIDIEPVWSYTLPNGVSVSSAINNEIRFVASNKAMIGDTFTLTMTADDQVYGVFEAQIVIEIGGLM